MSLDVLYIKPQTSNELKNFIRKSIISGVKNIYIEDPFKILDDEKSSKFINKSFLSNISKIKSSYEFLQKSSYDIFLYKNFDFELNCFDKNCLLISGNIDEDLDEKILHFLNLDNSLESNFSFLNKKDIFNKYCLYNQIK